MKSEQIAVRFRDTVPENISKEELKKLIFDDLSTVSQDSVKNLKITLNGNEDKNVPGRKGSQEGYKKQIYSEAVRNDLADMAAGILKTKDHGLSGYPGIGALMDMGGDEKADRYNQKISEVFLNGSVREKSDLMVTLTNPLLMQDPGEFEKQTEEELVLRWKEQRQQLYRMDKLDEMV